MRLYQLHSIQFLPIPATEAWDFLSDPENLKTITPEHMGFTILHPINKPMYPGQIIRYSVSPFPFFKTRWVTEITHVKTGEYFVEEQGFGPYKLWHHKHFIQVVKGGVPVAVRHGMPFHTSIAAAKGSNEGFNRALESEYAPAISVNFIAPSLTATTLAEKLLNTDKKREQMASPHPLKRFGKPEDIAECAAFLLGEQSSWMTGRVLGRGRWYFHLTKQLI